ARPGSRGPQRPEVQRALVGRHVGVSVALRGRSGALQLARLLDAERSRADRQVVSFERPHAREVGRAAGRADLRRTHHRARHRGDAMSDVATLTRTVFETSRLLEFFTEKELDMQIGHAKELWSIALLKELIDNSQDACESANVPPEICVEIEADLLRV